MKTLSLVAIVSVSLAACGGQIGEPETVGGGSGSESSSSGYASGSTSYSFESTSGYATGSGYETSSGYATGSVYSTSGYGTGSGYGTSSYSYGTSSYSYSTSGYGSGSGSEGCDVLPPGGPECGLPAGCTGGLVCEGGIWTCEIWNCQPVGECEGDAPYCVDGCGNYEPSYCDGDGNWACPPTPPCISEDAGVGVGFDGGVIGVPLPP
jgi:hypothetical protein